MVLVSVILVLLTIFTMFFALIFMTVTEINIVFNDEQAARAFYLADAGTQIAVDYLYSSPFFRGELLNSPGFNTPLAFEEGFITSIKIENISSNVQINSTAEVDGVIKKVELLIKVQTLEEEGEQAVLIDRLKWKYAF